MNIFIDCLLIIIIVCLILIWYITTYNRFQNYIIRINEAETNIDATLRKRFDLLNKAASIIKVTIDKEEVMEQITQSKSKKLSNFELDRLLYEGINELHTYKETCENLVLNNDFVKIDNALLESEAEIEAGRKYYNDIITDFNRMVKIFPSNFVALMSKYKTKTYYDGKNLEKKDTFKL